MTAVWKKTLNYLGLVEDEDDFVEEMPEAEPTAVRRMRPQAVREVQTTPTEDHPERREFPLLISFPSAPPEILNQLEYPL